MTYDRNWELDEIPHSITIGGVQFYGTSSESRRIQLLIANSSEGRIYHDACKLEDVNKMPVPYEVVTVYMEKLISIIDEVETSRQKVPEKLNG